MESVLPALIILLILFFATLTEAYSYSAAQGRIQTAQEVMQTRMSDQSRTSLAAVDTLVGDDGKSVDLTVRNTGVTRLTDFEQWDLIVQYYDTTHGSHVMWLPFYSGGDPTDQEWTVVGLYLDTANSVAEAYEPGILNPGEELLIRFRLPAAAEKGVAGMATLTTPNGVSVSTFFTRPKPPEPEVTAVPAE